MNRDFGHHVGHPPRYVLHTHTHHPTHPPITTHQTNTTQTYTKTLHQNTTPKHYTDLSTASETSSVHNKHSLTPARPLSSAPAPMSAMAESKSNGSSPKKQRTEAPKPRGIGMVIFSSILAFLDGVIQPKSKIWVVCGDRTVKEKTFWATWCAQWHGKEPHNIYTVTLNSDGDYAPLFVPNSAHTSGESHVYTNLECMRAIMTHQISKKWFAKTCFTSEQCDAAMATIKAAEKEAEAAIEAAIEAAEEPDAKLKLQAFKKKDVDKAKKAAVTRVAQEIAAELTDEQLMAMQSLLVRFTKWQNKGSATEEIASTNNQPNLNSYSNKLT